MQTSTNFINDIQGKDTQLFPLVVFEDVFNGTTNEHVFISTNNVVVDNDYYKPILLNIPTIKESIDIESRKFKISNVKLNISNVEFEGSRFSDILDSTTLINTVVSIFIKSPSTKTVTISQYDINAIDGCPRIYVGIVRNITHNKEKVTIVLEDLTEKTAHIDLPSQYTDDTDNYPNKYKNKPIPMVYGRVKKSPCIISGVEFGEYSEPVATQLTIDYRSISYIAASTNPISHYNFTTSGVMVGESGEYIDIDRNNIDANPETAKIGIISSDGIVTSSIIKRNVINILPSYLAGQVQFPIVDALDSVEYITNLPFEYITQSGEPFTGDIETSDISLHMEEALSNISDISSNSGIMLQGMVTDDNASYHYMMMQLDKRIMGLDCKTWVLMKYDRRGDEVDANLNNFLGQFVYFDSTNEIYSLMPTAFSPWAVWAGTMPKAESDVVANGNELHYSIDEEEGYVPNPDEGSIYNWVSNWFVGDEDNILNDNLLPYQYPVLGFDNISSFDFVNIGAIKSYDNLGFDKEVVFAHKDELKEFFVIQEASIDKLSTRNFYADVRGRVTLFDDNGELAQGTFISNPIDIIYDLVRQELGHDAIDEEEYIIARALHADWNFAFTITKKINSKKLIEDIAKSTRCFPKFKNNGKFGFNVIQNSYGSFSEGEFIHYEQEKIIKSFDVIDYSFSNTKPEQVYKRVDIQYNKDYEEGEYINRTSFLETGEDTGVIDTDSNWGLIFKDDYNGIEHTNTSYLQFESDYIRNESTAFLLRKFLSEQYKNQHLTFKIKVPLSYVELEIGDIVRFDKLLGGIKVHGNDYTTATMPNGQVYYPYFMLTSTRKTLEYIEIEGFQLHHLLEEGEYAFSEEDLWDAFPTLVIDGAEEDENTQGIYIYPSLDVLIDGEGDGWDGQTNMGHNYVEFELPLATCWDDEAWPEAYSDIDGNAIPKVRWLTYPYDELQYDIQIDSLYGNSVLLTDNVTEHYFEYQIEDQAGHSIVKTLIVPLDEISVPFVEVTFSSHSNLSESFFNNPGINGQGLILDSNSQGSLGEQLEIPEGFMGNELWHYRPPVGEFGSAFTHVLYAENTGENYYQKYCGIDTPNNSQLLFSAFDSDDGIISENIVFGYEAINELTTVPLTQLALWNIGWDTEIVQIDGNDVIVPVANNSWDETINLNGIGWDFIPGTSGYNHSLYPCIAGVQDSNGNTSWIRWNLLVIEDFSNDPYDAFANTGICTEFSMSVGELHVTDVVASVTRILTPDYPGWSDARLTAADITGDGELNVLDVVTMVSSILEV